MWCYHHSWTLEVRDGAWIFTVSVSVIGGEEEGF